MSSLLTLEQQQQMRNDSEKFATTLESMYKDLDKTYIRRFQRLMYACALKCCDNENLQGKEFQSCLDGCSTPLQQAQAYTVDTLQDVQTRLQRCLMVCQDSVKDKMSSNKISEAHKKEFQECSSNCFSKYTEMLPSTFRQLKNTLDQQAI